MQVSFCFPVREIKVQAEGFCSAELIAEIITDLLDAVEAIEDLQVAIWLV